MFLSTSLCMSALRRKSDIMITIILLKLCLPFNIADAIFRVPDFRWYSSFWFMTTHQHEPNTALQVHVLFQNTWLLFRRTHTNTITKIWAALSFRCHSLSIAYNCRKPRPAVRTATAGSVLHFLRRGWPNIRRLYELYGGLRQRLGGSLQDSGRHNACPSHAVLPAYAQPFCDCVYCTLSTSSFVWTMNSYLMASLWS